MDLSNSVILPREDFLEMQEVAWNQPPVSFKDRSSSVAQTTLIVFVTAAAFTVGRWGWVTATDWYEKKAQAREIERASEAAKNTKISPKQK